MLLSRVSKGEEFSKRESIFNNHGTAYEVLTVKKDHEQRLNYTQANFFVFVFCYSLFFVVAAFSPTKLGLQRKMVVLIN